MITLREIVLAFLVPALLTLALGALAARLREGAGRRLLQALAPALAYGIAFDAISHYVPLLDPLASATQLVPLLVLPVVLASALARRAVVAAGTLALLALLFARLGTPPSWPERILAALVLGAGWWGGRPVDAERPWRAPLVLATFAGAVSLACICGRVASLSLIAAGLATCAGASFAVSLRRPAWSFGAPGQDVALFALGGTLACAVYLGELHPLAALLLLASLLTARLPSFPRAFVAQLVLTALAIGRAWPAGGIAP